MTEQSNDPPAPRQAPHGLGTLEAQLMDVLWATTEQLSVQGVVDQLGPGHNYKTAMTVLNRLVEKGLLERELDGRAYRYRPTQPREDFLQSVAEELVREYIEAYGSASGAHLTQAIDAAVPRPAHTPAAPTTTAARQAYADDEPEPRSGLWGVIGVAAALQIITFLLRRRGQPRD
ncbi:MAG: BlaI/MecI/CopY family transcriptional regulator [Chloroflexi bacterium]|nr:BlaI/MecI/CopY family transcriptional regulator [Chloroflexota bacterium]